MLKVLFLMFDTGNRWNSDKFMPYQDMLKSIKQAYPSLHQLEVPRHETAKVASFWLVFRYLSTCVLCCKISREESMSNAFEFIYPKKAVTHIRILPELTVDDCLIGRLGRLKVTVASLGSSRQCRITFVAPATG
jgi:hypothetical protein